MIDFATYDYNNVRFEGYSNNKTPLETRGEI